MELDDAYHEYCSPAADYSPRAEHIRGHAIIDLGLSLYGSALPPTPCFDDQFRHVACLARTWAWDTWIGAGLERLIMSRSAQDPLMRDALYTIWTEAFGELPFIRALIAPGEGNYPRYMEALLVNNKILGSLQYRFDKNGGLFGMSLDMPSTIDPNAQQLRLSALHEPSQIRTEGLEHLTLLDPTSDWNWQTKLGKLLKDAPPDLVDGALKAGSIWRQVIFPTYKRSHYGILARFLRCPIHCLPEILAAEGLTKTQDFHRASACIRHSAVYRRVNALSGLPGLADAVENHSIHGLAREGHRPPDKTSILFQLTEAIERAIPNPEIRWNGRLLSRSAVICLTKLDVDTVRHLGHDLNFIADVLLSLPPHLHPKTHEAQSNFCLYFCAIQSGRSKLSSLTYQCALLAACRQFELRSQPPPQFETAELNGLGDFLDWVLGIAPPNGSEDHPTAAWLALGRPTLTRLRTASAQWHDALVDATATLEAAANGQETDENSAGSLWPALLAEPATVNDYQFICLTGPTALRLEGSAMSHCVSFFTPRCLMGSHILSVRRMGKREATITVMSKDNKHTEWQLKECSGPGNSEPAPEVLQASRELVLRLNSKALAPNPEVLTFQYEECPVWSSAHRNDMFQELVSLHQTAILERFTRLLRCGKKTTPASESFINCIRDAYTNQLGHRSSSAIG